MVSSDPRPLLLFLHIRKAGGTTLKDIIDRHYDPAAILRFEVSTMQLARDGFSQLSEPQKRGLEVIAGQMPFGLHRFLPRPSTYITLMRDPIDRVVSYYHHVLRRSEHYAHDQVVSEKMSLHDFVCSGVSADTDNGLVRTLCGIEDVLTTPEVGQCSREMLENAKKNIEQHFPVAGLLERFDETLILLRRTFGWKDLFYTRKNVNPNRAGKQTVDVKVRAEIEKRNALDMELYGFTRKRFDSMLSRQGPGFVRELSSFRRLNALYRIKILRTAVRKVRAFLR